MRYAAAAAIVLAALSLDASISAQSTQSQVTELPQRVLLTAGRSTVLVADFDITRLAVTNPAVADAVVVKPREVLVDGKSSGTVSLIVWGANERKHYDIVVDPGVTPLQQNFMQLFPSEDINVAVTQDAVILSGSVSSNEVMLRSAELARAAMPKHQVINMLQLPGGSPAKQVMLQVRFAEVNRNALQQAGLSLFASREDVAARSATQQFGAPEFDRQGDIELLQFSDFLNLFVFDRQHGVGGILKALQTRGFLQSLAEPNLIAYNGEEASFLAGGEIPIPLITGLGQVNVQYKEFGIRLTFRPQIAGDVIRLKLKPEVSTLDFTNGIVLQGFRIPALNTRRAETDVELRDGQSFAIAGLLNNLTQTDRQAVPILSRIPILGSLFKSRSLRADQTELMVLVTPRLVQALDPDEVPALPVRPGAFLNPSDDENENLEGETPDEAATPSLRTAPRQPPPGTVKPTRPPGGGLDRR